MKVGKYKICKKSQFNDLLRHCVDHRREDWNGYLLKIIRMPDGINFLGVGER